jgi:hypothetical protein
MTAALNVFGNVFEYDTNLDVFENVFEWDAPITDGSQGWSFDYPETLFFFQSSPVLFMISGEDQAFSFEES